MEDIKYNVYLDTETTDIKPGQIAELSMIVESRLDASNVFGRNYFFSVDSMDPGAEQVHGFSVEKLEELSGGAKFSDKLPELLDVLSSACVVAHNEAFDERFISMEMWRCGISWQPKSRVCTMNGFTPLMKLPGRWNYKYKSPKLSEVMDWLGIDFNKVQQFKNEIFNDSSFRELHDSRIDTAALFAITKVYGESKVDTKYWTYKFCK